MVSLSSSSKGPAQVWAQALGDVPGTWAPQFAAAPAGIKGNKDPTVVVSKLQRASRNSRADLAKVSIAQQIQ